MFVKSQDVPVAVSEDGKWHYWVAYSHITGGGFGFGGIEIVSSGPVTSSETMGSFASFVEQKYSLAGGTVVILGFQVLQVPRSAIR
jgi:hypothetical protein